MKKLLNKKWIIAVFLFIVTVICLFTVSGCTKKQEKTAVEKFGESKAFNHYNGKEKHLASNSISFYIDSSVSGQYKTAAENAIAKANAVSSKISITKTSSSSTSFKIKVSNFGSEDTNGVTNSTCDRNAGIYKATITLYSNVLGSRTLNYKKHTAVHEMGHVLGLGHITDSSMEGETVMFAPHPNGEKYQSTDFTKFDKHNLIWMYGE